MLQLTLEPDDRVLIARWDELGHQEDFPNDGTTFQYKSSEGYWRWLIDLRQHGDLNDYNTSNFLRNRVVDTARRAPDGEILRVALLTGQGFITLENGLPDDRYQQRHRFAVQLFLDEGEARRWLLQEPAAT